MDKHDVHSTKIGKDEKKETIKKLALWYGFLFWILASATYYMAPSVMLFKPYMNEPSNDILPIASWTVIIYITLYPHVMLVFYSAKCRIALRNLGIAYIIAVIIGTMFFICLPTSIVHEPLAENTFFDSLLVLVKNIDVDHGNAFPSLHVVFSMLGPIMLFMLATDKQTIALLIWGVLISISTLTTAQHHIIDLIGGLTIALVLAYLFANRTRTERKINWKRLKKIAQEKRKKKEIQSRLNQNPGVIP